MIDHVFLFSGGKDSILLVHLALKAFRPGKIPIPLVHIDTRYNFSETLKFRNWLVKEIGEEIVIRKVEDTIIQRNLSEPRGRYPNRSILQSCTLIDTIKEFQFDGIFISEKYIKEEMKDFFKLLVGQN